jgi:hypothetical protein
MPLVELEGRVSDPGRDLVVLDLDLGQGAQETALGVLEILGVAERQRVERRPVVHPRDRRGVLGFLSDHRVPPASGASASTGRLAR